MTLIGLIAIVNFIVTILYEKAMMAKFGRQK